MDLLEKASVILTPTAYNNGEALCVKPSDGSGDFDFSRNSAATRVNAQGLVENVQILSSNLVQNGDFSEEGAEEVSNGSFTNGSTDWTLQSEWSIGTNKAIYDNSSSGNLVQSFTWQVGKTYKITFDIGDFTTNQRFDIYSGVSFIKTATAENNTSYEIYFKGDGGSTLRFRGLTTESFSITNISVKEVGQNWSITGTGWNISDNGLSGLAAEENVTQPISTIVGKKYVIKFTISNWVSGDVYVRPNNSAGTQFYVNGNGTYTEEFTGVSNSLVIRARPSIPFTGTISNISVIEITDDTNLPRINYEGFSYQDVLGSELITNGDFATDSNWSKGAAWTISGGTANFDDTATSGLSQNMTFVSGKTYKISFEVISGTASIGFYSSNGATAYIGYQVYAIGTHNVNFLHSTGANLGIFGNKFAGTAFSIDNVSVKEYLGQEVVPNSGCGSWLFEPQSTNLLTYSEDFSQSVWLKVGDTTIESGYLAPDGTNSAYKVSGTNSSMFAVASLLTTTTRSIYAKTVSGTGQAHLLSYSDNTNNLFTITEDWQRFEVNSAIATGAANFYAIDFRSGTTLTEIILWGANATNDQDYATSYIPTSGSSVTRNQDVCNNGGSLATINSTEGVLYAEIAALADDNTFRSIALSDGTINNRVMFLYTDASNGIRVLVFRNNALQVILNHTINITDVNKVAVRYKLNDVTFWVNGVKLSTDTNASMPIGLNELSFSRGDGDLPFFGKTKCLAVFPYLTDAELTELTTI